MTNAYILDAVRTPRGRGKAGKGALSNVHPQELLAQTLNRLAERAGIDPADVEDVIAGCVSQAPQGISADVIASLEGISREELDAFALESQRKAAVAQSNCYFGRGLFPVKDPATGQVLLEKDEHPRHDTTIEGLASLNPAFTALGATPVGPTGETLDQIALARYPQLSEVRHVHTAGNSSGIVDGAAAVLIGSGDYAKAHGLKPRA